MSGHSASPTPLFHSRVMHTPSKESGKEQIEKNVLANRTENGDCDLSVLFGCAEGHLPPPPSRGNQHYGVRSTLMTKGCQAKDTGCRVGYAIAWLLVYWCRIDLLINGWLTLNAGLTYLLGITETAIPAWKANASAVKASDMAIPFQIGGVAPDDFVVRNFGGLMVLAPFMGAAYCAVGTASILAGFAYGNLETAFTALIHLTMMHGIGVMVRPSMPSEFYKPGGQEGVQRFQMVGVITLLAGFLSIIVPVCMGIQVPTPLGYVWRLICHLRNKFCGGDKGQ